MSDLVENPEDRFSQNEAHMIVLQMFQFHYDLQEYTGKYCTRVGNELQISKEYAQSMY